MKLVSVQRGRAIWLFPLTDLNPAGKYIIPVVLELVKRYKFANVPNVAEAIKKKEGAIFGQGAFDHGPMGEIEIQLAVYSDGLIADTATDTDASASFLEDMLSWLQKDFGLRYPETIKRLYTSEIYVTSEKALASLNPRLNDFVERLNEVSRPYRDSAYACTAIAFTAPQTSAAQNPPFRFESTVIAGRYFSMAGVTTTEHLELLEKLEAAL